jgi:hypothetical protein
MFVCGCADPACQINGCRATKQFGQTESSKGYAEPVYQPSPITAEQVRQIVREEIAKAIKEMK